MKRTKILYTILMSCMLSMVYVSCENPDLNPNVDPLPGVQAYTVYAEDSPTNFVYNDPSVGVTFDIQWISIDKILTVNKIEVYALFNENYLDQDRNPQVARHGGTEGILMNTIEGSDVPANRTNTSFTVTQAEFYNLYSDITYDYGNGNGEVPVFTSPNPDPESDGPDRTPTARFIPGDEFALKWILYTSDGQVFDSWSPSVCSDEFAESNCEVSWGVDE